MKNSHAHARHSFFISEIDQSKLFDGNDEGRSFFISISLLDPEMFKCGVYAKYQQCYECSKIIF